MYDIKIKRDAKKKLVSLSAADRLRITEAIIELGFNPASALLDIKKLIGEKFWRLRVGKWRIIYDRNDSINIIAIEKIKSRGDAYK